MPEGNLGPASISPVTLSREWSIQQSKHAHIKHEEKLDAHIIRTV
jgi:hypothetical protein